MPHSGANVSYLDCGNGTDRGQVVIGQLLSKAEAKRRPERLPHVMSYSRT